MSAYEATQTSDDHYTVKETETGNTVALLEVNERGWNAWEWSTGYALLRNDYAGKAISDVMNEADEWI